ncbi:hypothetical protein BSLA_02r0770 [Burkholderia stabilis]|nr:hypothetical protein BSLA_02r0770 [Burkholderia stabilis]
MKNYLEPAPRTPRANALAALLLSLAATPAFAQSAPPAAAEPAAGASDAAAPAQQAADAAAPAPTGFWERSNLLGNMGGLRDLLGDHGVTLSL